MLLTEDDLQSITDYVVGKRKLTNRSVFGAGVVCGLGVTRDPCEPGTVVVDPGYAIDCCGNDIVVECAEPVDVLALVDALRREQGLDCGDPCDPKSGRRTYVLSIRYAERLAGMVAPYAADECEVGDCDYSRVEESYCFVLSCDPQDDEPNIIDALRDCLRDPVKIKEDVREFRTFAMLSVPDVALEAVEIDEAVPTAAEFRAVDENDLDAVRVMLTRSMRAVAHHDDIVAGAAEGQRLRGNRRQRLVELSGEMVERARAVDDPNAIDKEALARLDRLVEVQRSDLSKLEAIDRRSIELGLTPIEADREYVRSGEQLRRRVLRTLEDQGRVGTPEYAEVRAMQIGQVGQRDPDVALKLLKAYVDAIVACICAAVHPPCPTCTDLNVPLAALTVERCEVVDVCMLERRWVQSPRAMAYWFPVVEALRRVLQRVCCADEKASIQDYDGRAKAIVEPAQQGWMLQQVAASTAQGVDGLEQSEMVRILAGAVGATGPAADELLRLAMPVRAGAAREAPEKPAPSPQIDELEARVAELTKRLDELAGRGEDEQ